MVGETGGPQCRRRCGAGCFEAKQQAEAVALRFSVQAVSTMWSVIGASSAPRKRRTTTSSLKDGGLCCPPTRPIHAARAPGMAITRCGSSIEAVRSATTFLLPDKSPGARV